MAGLVDLVSSSSDEEGSAAAAVPAAAQLRPSVTEESHHKNRGSSSWKSLFQRQTEPPSSHRKGHTAANTPFSTTRGSGQLGGCTAGGAGHGTTTDSPAPSTAPAVGSAFSLLMSAGRGKGQGEGQENAKTPAGAGRGRLAGETLSSAAAGAGPSAAKTAGSSKGGARSSSKKSGSAWKSASSSSGPSSRPCPFYKRIPDSSIVVDGFDYASPSLSSCYCLSHFHSDHTRGLTRRWAGGLIYCSEVTASLLQDRMGIEPQHIRGLALDTPHSISCRGWNAAAGCSSASEMTVTVSGGAGMVGGGRIVRKDVPAYRLCEGKGGKAMQGKARQGKEGNEWRLRFRGQSGVS